MDFQEYDSRKNEVEEKIQNIVCFIRPIIPNCEEYYDYEDDLLALLQKMQDAVSEFACYKQAFENELEKRGLIPKS